MLLPRGPGARYRSPQAKTSEVSSLDPLICGAVVCHRWPRQWSHHSRWAWQALLCVTALVWSVMSRSPRTVELLRFEPSVDHPVAIGADARKRAAGFARDDAIGHVTRRHLRRAARQAIDTARTGRLLRTRRPVLFLVLNVRLTGAVLGLSGCDFEGAQS
jgi:hypothetical protein